MALATKVYFDSVTVPTVPAGWAFVPSDSGGFAGWDTFGDAVQRTLAIGTKGASAYSNLAAVSAAGEAVLVVQYVAQLATGTVFTAGTDTLAMQILASYSGASPVDTPLVAMGIVSADGTTLKADLLGGAVPLAAVGNVNVTTKKNKTWVTGAASYANSYTTAGGEYLVIEVGFSASAAVSPITCSLRVGEGSGAGSDLPINQTQTADGIPWLQHTSAGSTPLLAARPDVCVGSGITGLF